MNRSHGTFRSSVGRQSVYQAVALLLGINLVAACAGDSPTAPVATKAADLSVSSFFSEPGCIPGAKAAGFDPAAQGRQFLVSSFGNAQSDAAFSAEVGNQRQFWGAAIPAAIYILNEGGPSYANAYADPRGYILFGYYFHSIHLAQHGSLAIDGTLAHEWGHRVQQTYGWKGNNPTVELEADVFSGYYMALRKGYAWSAIQGYYNHVYSTGDFFFNSSDHHGTPSQRLAAAYLGVNTAIYAMQNRQAYTYSALHTFFVQEITRMLASSSANIGSLRIATGSTDPLGRSVPSLNLVDIAEGRSVGTEVSYPAIRFDERERLFPRSVADRQ
jgi:hypothetical protein